MFLLNSGFWGPLSMHTCTSSCYCIPSNLFLWANQRSENLRCLLAARRSTLSGWWNDWTSRMHRWKKIKTDLSKINWPKQPFCWKWLFWVTVFAGTFSTRSGSSGNLLCGYIRHCPILHNFSHNYSFQKFSHLFFAFSEPFIIFKKMLGAN
jgi:hypothetical protein